MPASPTSAGGQPSVSVPRVIRRAGETESKHRSKIKIKDFDPEFHSTIHLACRYYQVILCTHEPFPLENEQDRYLREAWQLACAEHEVNLKANRDVLNLVKQRGSQVQGEVKRHARPVTTGHYKFDDRDDHVYQDQLAALVRELTMNHGILFKDHEVRMGLFENPCTARILRAQWFADAHAEGISFHAYFNPIPLPTLALLFTAIENCVDEWKDGRFRSIDFTEKLYREKYQSYLTNLGTWGDHAQGWHILARLQKCLHDKARTLSGVGDLQTTLPAVRKLPHDIFDAAVREATAGGEEEMLE
ncbi:hypothetical protein JB92DRAFT_3098557 [Gautieria morchelliformis]|nr:hypothetical protein JB92DRAFT_3098557 [Gautieria morchelliformis]